MVVAAVVGVLIGRTIRQRDLQVPSVDRVPQDRAAPEQGGSARLPSRLAGRGRQRRS